MNTFNTAGMATFFAITISFFVIRSRPIVFHLICALLIMAFVRWTGPNLTLDSVGEWFLVTIGLVLYWFGLVIVRVMLTRSVSLKMLSSFDRPGQTANSGKGISARLNDARQFGLMTVEQEGRRLTLFGRFIATIVAFSYAMLRIK
jgi:hypothetical protein